MVFDTGYMLIVILTAAVGGLIGFILRAKIKKYSNVPISAGITGAEVARRMLEHYGLYDVQVVEGRGVLTDHYNPRTKTISLSPEIYRGRTIASTAVAAHECGHAVQHAEAYQWLEMRSAIVPLVQFSARAQQWVLIGAFAGVSAGLGNILLLACVFLFSITAFFSVITLPVEFDATKRGLAWLDSSGIARGSEHDGARDALKWAAMTYVAAAMSAMIMVLYLISKMGNRR
ncbi:MAG: zinc metallopeptidase [Bacteroidota bacterium]